MSALPSSMWINMPHMCIYTNAELQACSRGGRGRVLKTDGIASISWGCCLSVCLCWRTGNHMWLSDVEKEKYLHLKMGGFFFFFFGMLLNMSHLSKHMILWYLGAYLWAQASGGASENHRLGFPFLLWPSVRDGVCSSWASPSHSLLQGGDKSMQCIFFLLNAKSSFKKGEWEIKFR